MRTGESFSGFVGLVADDVAVTASAGAIRDRANENLASSDLGIVRLYRRLRDLADCSDLDKPAIGQQTLVEPHVAFQADLAEGVDWRTFERRSSEDAPVRSL
jgi:hypothetical protein